MILKYQFEISSKQFRLREISEHHLFRKRPYLALQANDMDLPKLDQNTDATTVFRHIVEILSLQDGYGAYFDSLSKGEKEYINERLEELTAGMMIVKQLKHWLK